MRVNQNKVSVALIAIGSLLMVASVTLIVLVMTGVVGGKIRGNSDLETVTTFGQVIKTPTAGPSPTPSSEFPPGSNAPVARLIVPKAGIDANVVVKGVDAAGVMQTPDNAFDTAWYDFSAHPGSPGNAVFSGHVDYIHVGKAVFWNLKDLSPGDLIEVRLADGSDYKYAVTALNTFDADTAPVDEIVGRTEKQSVTLITCTGVFSSATHQYDKRLVVRAERIPDALPSASASGT
ncbi:MAG TPA: class F sortase [Dehalococcoidia bacterium]|nr:class F sortase [Dehalococcoidia bacterium]